MSSCTNCAELQQQVHALQLIVRKNTATNNKSSSSSPSSSSSSSSDELVRQLTAEKAAAEARVVALERRVQELSNALDTAAALSASGHHHVHHHHHNSSSHRKDKDSTTTTSSTGSSSNSSVALTAGGSPTLSARKARPGESAGSAIVPGSPVKEAVLAARDKSNTLPTKASDDYLARRAAREAEREDERKRREEERAARKKLEEDDQAARAEQREKRRQERLSRHASVDDGDSASPAQSGYATPIASSNPQSAVGAAASAAADALLAANPNGAAAAGGAPLLNADGTVSDLIVTDVPPRVTVQFGRSDLTVDIDIKASDTVGTLRRRLFDEKLVPPAWAEQRAGGGRYTQSDVLIGKMNDAKFEPHPARRTMHELRYELHTLAKLVVHVRPSIPLLPAGVRAPDLALRIKAALADSVGPSENNAKLSDSLAKRVAKRAGVAGAGVGSAPSSPMANRAAAGAAQRSAERAKWLPISDVLPFAEVAVKWEWSVADEAWQHSVVLVLVDARPFSEGQLRQAYYCRVLSDAQRGYVAKFAKNEREPRRTYFEDVRMQTIASDLAQRFNEEKPPKTVDVVRAAVLEFPYRSDEGGGDVRRVCGLEAAIDGVSVDTPFRKYNNNTGWKTDEGVRNTPQAFSHFTYEASKQQMIVVDIQGVAKVEGDVYTDPQIHSVGGVGFGVGNHGRAGIDSFLQTHNCNAVCQYLALPSVNAQPAAKDGSTTARSGTEPKPVLKL